MALTNTTLAAAVGINDVNIKVTAATGFSNNQPIRVDNEYMLQRGDANGLLIPVRRGLEGSAQLAHGILADVVTGPAADWPSLAGGQIVPTPSIPGRMSVGADTTLVTADLPTKDTVLVITKATAIALTIEPPSKAANGLRLTVRSATAAAHVVTIAAGIYGDAGSSDVLTFAAKIGASVILEANGGAWGPLALTNVVAA